MLGASGAAQVCGELRVQLCDLPVQRVVLPVAVCSPVPDAFEDARGQLVEPGAGVCEGAGLQLLGRPLPEDLHALGDGVSVDAHEHGRVGLEQLVGAGLDQHAVHLLHRVDVRHDLVEVYAFYLTDESFIFERIQTVCFVKLRI